ncbi:ABC-type sugar transport system permease subunit [Anaerotaenia torta]|uniref:carbohydrate ABC transporter permease n=1 Tax=Anaerotaenia torta TaxID=433293 RepID=UPI003D1BED9B
MKKKERTTAESKSNYLKRDFYSSLPYKKKKTIWGIIFLLPWAIGVLFFFLGPLVKTFYYSFFNMTLGNDGFSYQFAGLNNFKYIFTVDPNYNKMLIEALATVVKNVPFQIFVSLFVAILLNGKYKGRGFFRVVFFVPIILATGITDIELTDINVMMDKSQSFVSADFIIKIITNSGFPAYMVNMILEFVNSIFEVITKAGVQMLIFLAGLQGISPSLYEVAQIEGCTKFESFCKITLPMISPMIMVCMIYSLADTFAAADISEIINTTTFTNAKYGLGASMSAAYFLVSVTVVLLLSYLVSKVVFYYDN